MDVPFFNRITSHKPYVTWYTPGVFFGRRSDNCFRVTAPDGDAYPQVPATSANLLDIVA